MSKAESQNVLYRSLEELEDTPEFQEFLTREFPEGAENAPDGMTRRRWVQLMGASAVLAGVSGCRFENRKITPYAFRPEDRVPGETRTFATTIEWAGNVRPLFVTSYDARPIKADGSPIHPATAMIRKDGSATRLGASDAITQACVLDLYDPDRSRGCLEKVDRDYVERSWDDFAAAAASLGFQGDGAGVVVLAEPTTSRTVSGLKKKMLSSMPAAQWFEYAPINSDNEVAGLKAAFGKSLRPHYDLSKAEVVVCLDADPLVDHPDALKIARGWSKSRVPDDAVEEHRQISRLYSVESQFTVTGANADHRWPV
ncbi:MAG: TAT-variant-translocated molybdopterin oxidoreductase, partial [Planctomycetota bacterium]|nr:TAT-variant-translocated molybdopterin oxidoreductase [Planctomycetota bacterium]